jgi:hypothetical protein
MAHAPFSTLRLRATSPTPWRDLRFIFFTSALKKKLMMVFSMRIMATMQIPKEYESALASYRSLRMISGHT